MSLDHIMATPSRVANANPFPPSSLAGAPAIVILDSSDDHDATGMALTCSNDPPSSDAIVVVLSDDDDPNTRGD